MGFDDVLWIGDGRFGRIWNERCLGGTAGSGIAEYDLSLPYIGDEYQRNDPWGGQNVYDPRGKTDCVNGIGNGRNDIQRHLAWNR
jgi:hypothetical protein